MIYRKPYIFYCDFEYHFNNEKLKEYLRTKEIVIDFSLFEFFKSTKIIELRNKLLKEVLRKNSYINLK